MHLYLTSVMYRLGWQAFALSSLVLPSLIFRTHYLLFLVIWRESRREFVDTRVNHFACLFLVRVVECGTMRQTYFGLCHVDLDWSVQDSKIKLHRIDFLPTSKSASRPRATQICFEEMRKELGKSGITVWFNAKQVRDCIRRNQELTVILEMVKPDQFVICKPST